jgi:hypothetical protein
MYAWNILLRCKQFTQEELLEVREYCCLPEMIRYQKSVTLEFLETHFAEEIDACLEVDWEDCRLWIHKREHRPVLHTMEDNTDVH